MYILKLIRLPNLLILALTQYVIRFSVIKPFYDATNLKFSLHEWQFALLVLSTVLIAAAGYIINDYFDVAIDTANRKENFIATGIVSEKKARLLFYILSGAGILIGAYFSYIVRLRPYLLINLLTVGLLYFYAQSYKRMFLVGNIVVAALSAASVFIVSISDREMQFAFSILNIPTYSLQTQYLRLVIVIIAAYSVFAFFISLIREIVKDIEDINGDKENDCKTMPIVMGVGFAKWIAQFFIFTLLCLIILIQVRQQQWENKISFSYVVLTVQLPLLILSILLFKATHKKHYTECSSLCKVIMLTGVLSMAVFNYTS
ncbi:MAG: geranylgeranylglycerol-phosphate geranylgeranyltransferase [Bacteroidetes bacterium]|nr:geranylgeranylglycerol-phosphate geranylgeranyltransferase [Bacteroidota bacterium]HNR20547.1 geranylgeranylglycerol-phosphate geranylgeranyltransferase [Bacteroidia bacterium]HNU33171.1 geranylgeranylglycerol-phosphate geranylgeranyltransferase [Bacteroidia bacterium]